MWDINSATWKTFWNDRKINIFHYRHFYMGVREAFGLKFVLFQTFLRHVKIITECFALFGIKPMNWRSENCSFIVKLRFLFVYSSFLTHVIASKSQLILSYDANWLRKPSIFDTAINNIYMYYIMIMTNLSSIYRWFKWLNRF